MDEVRPQHPIQTKKSPSGNTEGWRAALLSAEVLQHAQLINAQHGQRVPTASDSDADA